MIQYKHGKRNKEGEDLAHEKAPLWCTNCEKWTTRYDKKTICFCGSKVSQKHQDSSKNKISRGDKVGETFSGTAGIIADIQYEFDRYQFEHTSDWRYGIENIFKLD